MCERRFLDHIIHPRCQDKPDILRQPVSETSSIITSDNNTSGYPLGSRKPSGISHSGGHPSALDGGEGVAVYSVNERVLSRVGVVAPFGTESSMAQVLISIDPRGV